MTVAAANISGFWATAAWILKALPARTPALPGLSTVERLLLPGSAWKFA
jgi:hypothetical protein